MLCFKSMQMYSLCMTLCLCGSCVYFLAYYKSASTVSPLARPRPHTNQHIYAGRTGFMMGLDYSDQLTSGGMNVFTLQCLAYSIDPQLVVVEPFVVESTFGAALDMQHPAAETPWKGNAIRMSDIYNMSKWMWYSNKKRFAPLVSWETLLDVAPRDVVLVQHVWNDDCSLEAMQEKYAAFFRLYRFRVVHKVCFNFKLSGKLELWRYKDSVYDQLDPTAVTVIYEKWFGVNCKVAQFRVSICDSGCDKTKHGPPLFNDMHATPTQKIYDQARLYASRFLGGITNNSYIAVMLRTERILRSASNKTDKSKLLSGCLENVVKAWEHVKSVTGITETLLTLDYGKYGSKGFHLNHFCDLNMLEEKLSWLLSTMKQGNLTAWESRFSEVAGTENPGYVASLQKTISMKARCLITLGGGTFQTNAFMMHKKSYKEPCYIRLDSKCKTFGSKISNNSN